MTSQESTLSMCERHVREGEARVARQKEILAELLRDGHTGRVIDAANTTLDTLTQTLTLAQQHLERERAVNAGVIEQNGGGPGVRLSRPCMQEAAHG